MAVCQSHRESGAHSESRRGKKVHTFTKDSRYGAVKNKMAEQNVPSLQPWKGFLKIDIEQDKQPK